jgi:hypothetical protein
LKIFWRFSEDGVMALPSWASRGGLEGKVPGDVKGGRAPLSRSRANRSSGAGRRENARATIIANPGRQAIPHASTMKIAHKA